MTFRQTDPLYVLDLRDAAAPKVVGELKIPGYSGYLHPVGEDLLLGVGQSGVDAGNRGQPGVQFSLFDISDPASPRRIDTQTYGGGAAAAEFDPKAFLYWQPRNLIIAPTNVHGDFRGQGAFSGLVLLRANADGLKELGRLASTDVRHQPFGGDWRHRLHALGERLAGQQPGHSPSARQADLLGRRRISTGARYQLRPLVELIAQWWTCSSLTCPADRRRR